MDGRRRAGRSDATPLSLVALAVVLALVFVPSMGPGSVPAGLVTSVSPAAAVVHVLGDEVVAATPAPAAELRVRPLAPTLPPTTLAAALGLGAVLGAGWLLVVRPARRPELAVVRVGSGRSPPRAVSLP